MCLVFDSKSFVLSLHDVVQYNKNNIKQASHLWRQVITIKSETNIDVEVGENSCIRLKNLAFELSQIFANHILETNPTFLF